LQVKELKQELAMRDVLAGRGRVPYGDMDDSQLLELRDTMRKASTLFFQLTHDRFARILFTATVHT
jgi:hypothetical protein